MEEQNKVARWSEFGSPTRAGTYRDANDSLVQINCLVVEAVVRHGGDPRIILVAKHGITDYWSATEIVRDEL